MTLSNRTKISLSQFLDLFELSLVNILFEKYSIDNICATIDDIKEAIFKSSIQELLNEIILTKQDLRARITPKYRFEDRWSDLEKCLFLDGYIIEAKVLTLIEPNIDGVLSLEDDLTHEINNSSLTKKIEIITLINDSANAFKSNDFNGCLSKARISLETIVRGIAEDKFSFTDSWGKSLNKLKIEGFISQNDENIFSSSYTFVSDGSHIPLGFTHEEYARYGRNLIMSQCYYIIKKYIQQF